MRTVLIADSDAFQRQLIDMLLAVDNHRVLGFETGRSVLEYLQGHVPDLVILDYSLPDINGADLCSKMKKVKRLAHVPVILVTAAHKLELVRGIATAVRADLVLAKPLGDKHLREHVLELLKDSSKVALAQPEAKVTSTAIQIDPVLEQALANLTHESLIASSQDVSQDKKFTSQPFMNSNTPVLLDRDEDLPYTLELPNHTNLPSQTNLSSQTNLLGQPKKSHLDNLPPLFHDAFPVYEAPKEPLHEVKSDAFQKDANAALESLLGSGNSGANSKDTSSGVFEFFDDDDGNGISEQELLDSLQTPLETHSILSSPTLDQPVLNPPPFSSENQTPEPDSLEPQAYTLRSAASTSSTSGALAASFEESVAGMEAELETYRTQVQQLSTENERLRGALLELETGAPLASSKSYLDMVEELEMLRRLTDIQVKQMDSLQRQNQKLMEDAQQAQERRRGLFGFLQNKNQP